MAEITVVIPTYNGEKWITRCLDSLRAQTFRDFCVLVIDDGSTDGTVRMMREYKKMCQICLLRWFFSQMPVSLARETAVSP